MPLSCAQAPGKKTDQAIGSSGMGGGGGGGIPARCLLERVEEGEEGVLGVAYDRLVA
jgi:hypothetical protein